MSPLDPEVPPAGEEIHLPGPSLQPLLLTIGLIVPHLVRPMTDRSPSAILLPSALGGAALLTFADVLVRVIPTSNELKLGVVTAFLGVPVFLVHLMRERRL